VVLVKSIATQTRKRGRAKPPRQSMLTVDEVAVAIHVHPNTVRQWSDRGLLKAYRLGPRRDRRFSLEDIHNFLNRWDDSLDLYRSSHSDNGEVLIVSDDPSITGLLVGVARQQGCEPVAVQTGEIAVMKMQKHRFDLIFVDLVSPEFSGERVLEAIRAGDGESIVAVLIANGDEHIALKAMSQGFLFLIRKPFELTDIMHVIEVVMRARGKG
jgi:excisionase family DNA binding protein